ncbi:MlaD family protein [Desulfococcaceae bacterium HSG9]|nr:MlaD family protein [Desulfococcaceae bacterium HSG9]
MLKKAIILICILILAGGCWKTGLDLNIRFDRAQGIEVKDRVVFEGNHIGSVTKVHYADSGDYIISVTIESDFTNTATEDSQFFIIDDPQNAPHKAVDVLLTKKGGALLADGATVTGSVKPSPVANLFNQLASGWSIGMKLFGDQLGDWQKQFDSFSKELENIPDSEAYKQLQAEFNRLVERMKHSGDDVRDTIQNEILPRLQEEMDKMKKRLEQTKPKEKTAPKTET